MKITAIVIMLGLMAGAGGPAKAQFINSTVLEGPYYNPDTKSYFELRRAADDHAWQTFAQAARTLSYKGTSGRLAIVRSVETHDFLLKHFFHFMRHRAWIGLRLDCESRKLLWVDGTELKPDGFSVWNLAQWHNTHIRCSRNKISHMGVYYQPREEFFRWQAAGPAKVYYNFFVEYPTGKP